MGFHDDLRGLLRARGLTASQASLQAGLYAGAIPRYLRENSYPLPDAFFRIATALEAPTSGAAAWRQEAAEARPRHGPAFAARAKHRKASTSAMRICASPLCGKLFLPLDSETQYHSRKCFYQHRRTVTDQATQLQQAFLARVDERGLTLKAAAAAIGRPYSNVKGWLNRADGRLKQLDDVAAFLGVTVAQAVKLQGGTWAERQTHIARSFARPALHRWRRNKRNRRREKEALAKMHEAVRGRPKSEEHKRKIRDALRAYRQSPNAHRLGAHHSSPRGWVQQILRSLKSHHPDLPRHKLEELCLQKLRTMGRPFAGRDEPVARRLIAQRSKSRQKGGRPSVSKRDALIFVMRRRRDSWGAITGAVNAMEAKEHTAAYLRIYYAGAPSQAG